MKRGCQASLLSRPISWILGAGGGHHRGNCWLLTRLRLSRSLFLVEELGSPFNDLDLDAKAAFISNSRVRALFSAPRVASCRPSLRWAAPASCSWVSRRRDSRLRLLLSRVNAVAVEPSERHDRGQGPSRGVLLARWRVDSPSLQSRAACGRRTRASRRAVPCGPIGTTLRDRAGRSRRSRMRIDWEGAAACGVRRLYRLVSRRSSRYVGPADIPCDLALISACWPPYRAAAATTLSPATAPADSLSVWSRETLPPRTWIPAAPRTATSTCCIGWR